MRGIRREIGEPPHKKDAIGYEELCLLVDALPMNTLRGLRDRAVLLVGYASAMRRSELVGVVVKDLSFTSKLIIEVRHSKTDQEGRGMRKTIPRLGTPYCPVVALRAWLDAAEIVEGPVFRKIDRHNKVWPRALSGNAIAQIVKQAARAAGVDAANRAGHSLRIGFITTAAEAGVKDRDIMEQSGHTNVDTLHGYIQAAGRGASVAVRAAFQLTEKKDLGDIRE